MTPIQSPTASPRERGSALIPVLVMLVAIAGMCASMNLTSMATHRTAQASKDLSKASYCANSAVSYYEMQLQANPDYFVDNPAPHDELPMGAETFRLNSAEETAPDQWTLDITATSDSIEYRTIAVIGSTEFTIPSGLVLAGTGNPSDEILRMNGSSVFGSYDPLIGSATLNSNAGAYANGSIRLVGTATIHGDVTASGWIDAAGPSTITGTEVELASDFVLDAYEDVITPIIEASIAANDNATLAGIFGGSYTAMGGPGNPGDLSVGGGSYTVPAGTYLLNDWTVGSGATITFDTSTGPVVVVVSGSNGVAIKSGSTVQIDAGGTENGLQLVIENGEFSAQAGSTYGREISNPEASGYSQILSKSLFGMIESQGSSTVFARTVAPNQPMLVGGGSSWLGSAVVQSVKMIGSGPKFLIDESTLGESLGGSTGYSVMARWRGTILPSEE